MASKQVIDRQKSADSVVAVGETHALSIREKLAERAKAHLKKAESAPDYARVVTLACAELSAARDRLVKLDEAYEAELADDPAARAHRDTAAGALSASLVELREILTGAFGAATASAVLPGPTPADPATLARFAGETAKNLRSTKLPAPRIKGAKLDMAQAADDLEEQKAALEKALKSVLREAREAQAALDARNKALETYDEVFTSVAGILSAFLRLAGSPDLAAKVRPSTRRPGQVADTATPDTASEPSGPS